MPGEALTLHPLFSRTAAPEEGDGIGLASRGAMDRSLRRLSGARVPMVLVAVVTPPGAGRRMLPRLAELGLAAELSPDRLVLLSLGPSAAEPGSERRVATRVSSLLAAAGPVEVTALPICSDSIAGFDDMRDLLALEAPVSRPSRRPYAVPLASA